MPVVSYDIRVRATTGNGVAARRKEGRKEGGGGGGGEKTGPNLPTKIYLPSGTRGALSIRDHVILLFRCGLYYIHRPVHAPSWMREGSVVRVAFETVHLPVWVYDVHTYMYRMRTS